jgi:hypothetical protein
MPEDKTKKPGEKPRFKFCPECGRKGLYHIMQQYYRCRYCGTYIISPEEKIVIQPGIFSPGDIPIDKPEHKY